MVMSSSINLTSWMSDFPDALKDVPFIYLAIPGSHDSMTFGINNKSGLAPDAPLIVRNLWPVFRGSIIRWTRTQDADVTQQLEFGIRYFDLRIATKVDTHDLFFTHGLYGNEVTSQFNAIKKFLETYQEEVVVLDCQHFYGFQLEDHRKLFTILINTFGLKICPPQRNLEAITLRSMNKQKQQVIIIYRNEMVASSGRFWRSGQFPTPWPRKTSARDLLVFLKSIRRSPSAGFVTQAVLTPTIGFIILRWRSNIRDSCAKRVSRIVLPWISSLFPGPPSPSPSSEDSLRVNVVIADFIDSNDYTFPKVIIGLNYKLLV